MITNPQSGTNVFEIATGFTVSIPPYQYPARSHMDYYAHAPHTIEVLERLARERPETLACMHGSAWRGDGAALLRALAASLSATAVGTA